MKVELKVAFNEEYRLAICRPVGIVRAEYVGQLLNFLLAFEDSNPHPFNRLLDLTGVTEIQLKSVAIYDYARARRKATAHLPPFRTAIIAPELAETVAVIYATLMKGSKIEVEIFRDASSAAHWLAVP